MSVNCVPLTPELVLLTAFEPSPFTVMVLLVVRLLKYSKNAEFVCV